MPNFEIFLGTSDDPSGIKEINLETNKYAEALAKAAAQEEKLAISRAAKEHLKTLSAEEKTAAAEAYRLYQEQTKAATAIGQTGTAAGGAAGAVVNIKNAWMEAASAIQVMQTVLRGVQEAYDQTTGKSIEYGSKVRDLTQLTGLQADQASRYIQMADDLEVQYSDLSQSLNYMARQGIVPNIENLAKLSDEYVKLEDQNARNELVYKNLGKSGMELVNILEQGGDRVKALAAGVEEGLIYYDEDIENIKTLIASQDDFNDRLEIEKLKIGNEMIPVWQGLLDVNQAYMEMREKDKTTWMQYVPILQNVYAVVLAVRSVIDGNTLATERNAAAAKKAAEETKKQGAAINGLPTQKNTTVSTTFTYNGYRADYMAAFMASHPDYVPGHSTSGISAKITSYGFNAGGGRVSAGRPTWVGEEGPEPFIPAQDGYILSKNDAMKALGGGGGDGGIVVNLTYSPLVDLADKRTAAYDLANLLEVELKRKGVVFR